MTRNAPSLLARHLAHVAVGVLAVTAVRQVLRPGLAAQVAAAAASIYLHELLDAPLAAELSSIGL